MTLSNEGLSRSAINIEPNAKLNLYIAKDVTLTVNSGFGQDIPIASTTQSIGGKGGCAGIRVPWIDSNNNGERDGSEQAELNVYGEGTLVSYGGDAADGAGTISNWIGGGRRTDGAGARYRTAIGGNGGNSCCSTGKEFDRDNNHGYDGGNGENCGIVKIHDNVIIYAYGGGGREWRSAN